ncbi:MAG: XRE family transcriptional regulator [Bacteroidetes bacterium]|nr:MAG: XRE family transcriptional regulator [Bacteroidota bacterium]REK06574.1 MAG: XRE family transcriptional regulator [Bacteroidota bacterium]REK33340.1 MAG: XRE family transcriptional regulator [Bacteroidota bacterium]REK49740.1 MAG: XRE family transcriptional regulator [Bacteroidota bacterium]
MDYKPFIQNNNLKKFRTEKGLLQKQVAAMLGLKSDVRVIRWEKGQAIPSLINLMKLSKIYGVLPHKLYSQVYDNVVVVNLSK